MNANRFKPAMKPFVAVLCAACFLTMSFGAASRAIAAEDWPVWPKKSAEPGVEATPPPPPPQVQPQPAGAAKEGSDAGDAVKKGTSAGNIGWIAAGVAAAIGIAVAAGGGSSSTSAPSCAQ